MEVKRTTELKRKIKAIEKEQLKLTKQEAALYEEIYELERSGWLDKVKKNIHIGDIRMVNEGIIDYHCDIITFYEVLDMTPVTQKHKRNGVQTTFTTYRIKVRIFSIYAYDNDRISRIEIKNCFDADTLLKAKKVSKELFEDFKATVFLDPDSYDKSKWNPVKE